MIYFFILLFLATGAVFLYLKKDFLYPAAIVNFVYSLVVAFYVITEGYYKVKLASETLFFIYVMILIFSLSCLCGDVLTKKYIFNQNYLANSGDQWNLSRTKVISYLLLFVSLTYIISRFYGYTFSEGFLRFLKELRGEDVTATSRNPVAYLQPFLLVTWCLFFYSNQKSKDKVSIGYFSAVTLIFFFALLMNTGKQIFFMIIIATSVLIGIKKIKQVIIIAILAIGLFSIYMSFLRGYGGPIEYYVSLYLVSPTVAFQEYYFNHHAGISISSNLFWFFERVSGFILGTNNHMIIHKEFVNVGVRTNVYTAFADYIYYSTFLCVVLTSVHGLLIGALWRLSNINWIAAVFYALFCYSAIFLFYHESFIVNISSWIQILVAIFIVGKLSKVIAKS